MALLIEETTDRAQAALPILGQDRSEQHWYFSHNDQQYGPIAASECPGLAAAGLLRPQTLVWSAGMAQSLPAEQIAGLLPQAPALPPIQLQPAAPVDAREPSSQQVRPWVRCWARMIDYLLCGMGLALAALCYYEPLLDLPDAQFSLIALVAYLFVEPAMLAAWGTTPGKALLGIRLRCADGSELSYSSAFKRSVDVWFRGGGMGLPIFGLIANINAYFKLKKNGITSWDEAGGFQVSHQRIGAWRIFAVALLLVAFVLLMAYGAVEEPGEYIEVLEHSHIDHRSA